MNLDTYESDSLPGVFVTLPSVEARTTIATVDRLSALRLRPVRTGYTLRSDPTNAAFFEMIATELAATGYAVHGFDVAFGQQERAPVQPGPPRAH